MVHKVHLRLILENHQRNSNTLVGQRLFDPSNPHFHKDYAVPGYHSLLWWRARVAIYVLISLQYSTQFPMLSYRRRPILPTTVLWSHLFHLGGKSEQSWYLFASEEATCIDLLELFLLRSGFFLFQSHSVCLHILVWSISAILLELIGTKEFLQLFCHHVAFKNS